MPPNPDGHLAGEATAPRLTPDAGRFTDHLTDENRRLLAGLPPERQQQIIESTAANFGYLQVVEDELSRHERIRSTAMGQADQGQAYWYGNHLDGTHNDLLVYFADPQNGQQQSYAGKGHGTLSQQETLFIAGQINEGRHASEEAMERLKSRFVDLWTNVNDRVTTALDGVRSPAPASPESRLMAAQLTPENQRLFHQLPPEAGDQLARREIHRIHGLLRSTIDLNHQNRIRDTVLDQVPQEKAEFHTDPDTGIVDTDMLVYTPPKTSNTYTYSADRREPDPRRQPTIVAETTAAGRHATAYQVNRLKNDQDSARWELNQAVRADLAARPPAADTIATTFTAQQAQARSLYYPPPSGPIPNGTRPLAPGAPQHVAASTAQPLRDGAPGPGNSARR
ncbi:hypothetical protein ABT336_07735 [Micromonospora sp. NPDC000207]|uniref:hypothetical protein n=1 Tax=Micromonospora sp. NPDC000207 TaxID=3154246 RepID=UPI00331FDF3B